MIINQKYQQIKSLLEVINECKEKNVEIVLKRYKNIADNFEGVKSFLIGLKIINEKKGLLSIKDEFQTLFNNQQTFFDDSLKNMLLNKMLFIQSIYSQEIQDYLEKFDIMENSFAYKQKLILSVRESSLRNLFIELEFIKYYKSSGIYKIADKYFDTFERYLKRKKLSPEKLNLILKRKNDVGKAAELEVLCYEKERLGKYPELINKINHVSEENVLVGYDILSWDIDNDREVHRYIEVKSVTRKNCEFFWTRNEIAAAKKLTERYHLYLLPHIGNMNFDLGGLKIISNPIIKVLNNSINWNKQVETYLISRK